MTTLNFNRHNYSIEDRVRGYRHILTRREMEDTLQRIRASKQRIRSINLSANSKAGQNVKDFLEGMEKGILKAMEPR